MKDIYLVILTISLFLLCGCTTIETRPLDPDPNGIAVGKNWQIVEEPPKLSDDQGRLPFQKEQSVQPEAAKPQSPADNRTIKTPL